MPFFTFIPILLFTSLLPRHHLFSHSHYQSGVAPDHLLLTRRPPKAVSPALKNQVKAQETIAQLNRSQVAARLAGQTAKFTDNFDLLKVESLTGKGTAASGLYRYQIDTDGENFTRQTATPQRSGMKSYVGIVRSRTTPNGSNIAASILCHSKKPTRKILPMQLTPLDSNGVPTCPVGYQEVNY
jgi:Type IV pilin-like G and H, putative